MKFLCVPCDRPMSLSETRGPDHGSITLVYACDACGYETAMLTNAHETQVVSSLGIKIGPDGEAVEGASKCPFTGIAREMATEEPVTSTEAPPDADGSPRWTEQALVRLESIPSFLRPMAKTGIEKFAAERGHLEIDERTLDEARAHFGM